ncbi:ATP-binding protein [Nonomuraea indica]|uniref:ATP-binding protein n=1 Tax=Nonomuraea indica TaxID=1581193 RepID=A0ABW8AER1_9ACTN|nr:ATP-binding protein [Nonomuraea indica]
MNAFWDRLLGSMTVGPADRTASWQLPRTPSALRRARHAARHELAGWGAADQSDVVELLVSELVANAMEHARGTIRLTLSMEDGLLRGEVEDDAPEMPQLRLAGLEDEGGRGLQLVDMLSCCWGGDRTAHGKVVWFEVPASAPVQAPEEVVVTRLPAVAALGAELS